MGLEAKFAGELWIEQRGVSAGVDQEIKRSTIIDGDADDHQVSTQRARGDGIADRIGSGGLSGNSTREEQQAERQSGCDGSFLQADRARLACARSCEAELY